MNRLAVLLPLLGVAACLAAPGFAYADEPSVCTSMCAADKRECRAQTAKDQAKLSMLDRLPEKNPLARTAQAEVRSEQSRLAGQSDFERRRVAHAGACEDAYLRCVRSCKAAARPSTGKRDTAKSG